MSSWTRECFQRAPASVKWRGGGQGWVQWNNNQGISFDHRLSPGPRPSVTVSVTPGHVLPGQRRHCTLGMWLKAVHGVKKKLKSNCYWTSLHIQVWIRCICL